MFNAIYFNYENLINPSECMCINLAFINLVSFVLDKYWFSSKNYNIRQKITQAISKLFMDFTSLTL